MMPARRATSASGTTGTAMPAAASRASARAGSRAATAANRKPGKPWASRRATGKPMAPNPPMATERVLSAHDAIAHKPRAGEGAAATSIAGENSFAKRGRGDFNGTNKRGQRARAMNETDEFTGTMPVTERHRFDTAPLVRWMREHVDDFRGPLEIEQFRGGQSNPTFRLSAGGRRYVLRRKPPGKLLPSAHAVDREYRVITALRDTGVPVPRTFALCEDEAVIGTPFYIMEFVDGRVFWDQSLPEHTPADRSAVFEDMSRVIAALHKVDYARVGLADYGKPGNYIARQINRWTKQYRASETEH